MSHPQGMNARPQSLINRLLENDNVENEEVEANEETMDLPSRREFIHNGLTRFVHYCFICLEEFGPEHPAVRVTGNPQCNHEYGQQCIIQWLSGGPDHAPSNTCPICRAPLYEPRRQRRFQDDGLDRNFEDFENYWDVDVQDEQSGEDDSTADREDLDNDAGVPFRSLIGNELVRSDTQEDVTGEADWVSTRRSGVIRFIDRLWDELQEVRCRYDTRETSEIVATTFREIFDYSASRLDQVFQRRLNEVGSQMLEFLLEQHPRYSVPTDESEYYVEAVQRIIGEAFGD